MQGWKYKFFFSVWGKDILIKSVAQAIPSYDMSVFHIPKGFCNDIANIFTRFLWDSTKWQEENALDVLRSIMSP